VRSREQSHKSAGRHRAWPVILAATAAFAALGTLPLTLQALHVHLQPVAATSANGVTLLPAPARPAPVPLPPVARPIEPGQPPAALPAADAASEAAAVNTEDHRLRIMLHDAIHYRLRIMLHDAIRVYRPEVIPVRGSLPTLVLTAGPHAYTAADLVRRGALIMLKHNTALLLDNLFISTNAQLNLGGPELRVLYLDSTIGGFTSIVAWKGNLSFHGTASRPFTIMGWNRADNAPAADRGYGRPYIREVGGRMTLSNVRVSSLGFWSGRTGGVAWTGLTAKPSTGSASNSTFTDDTYGAFLFRSSGVTFRGDLFEFNELDGLRIHRYSRGTSVINSSSSRNGGNGFIVSRATRDSLLRNDVAEHNGGNGFYIDGRPLVTGASASGGSADPGSGATVEDSASLGNGKLGILVEGGAGTVIKANQVCAGVTGVAVRYNATNAVLTGNYISCHPRTGLSVGPYAPRATVSGNVIIGARMGIMVRSSSSVQLDNNYIFGATVFGITVRGSASRVAGVGNVLTGSGFRAVDARAQASPPALSSTNLSGWAHHARITFWTYLAFHPLAALWLGIMIVVLAAALWSHRRKLPPHPYPVTTRWVGSPADVRPTGPLPADPQPARPEVPALVGVTTRPVEVYTGAVSPPPAPPRHHVPVGPAAEPAANGHTEPAANGGRDGYGYGARWVPPWAPTPEPVTRPDLLGGQDDTFFDGFSPLPEDDRSW
jgi:hypothetical protein